MIERVALLSDADGTLVDTLQLIRRGMYETTRQYLSMVGIPADDIPSYGTYVPLLNKSIGPSARATLERAVRLMYSADPHYLANLNFDAAYGLLDPVQDKLAVEYVKPYPGLTAFLEGLGRKRIPMAIFTSGTPHHIVRNFGIALPKLGLVEMYKDKSISNRHKMEEFISAVKREYELPDFCVITCDDTTTNKPDPEGLLLAMRRLGLGAAGSIILGDHGVDMLAGKNAHIQTRIGITHGFNDSAQLYDSGATLVLDSLAEVLSSI